MLAYKPAVFYVPFVSYAPITCGLPFGSLCFGATRGRSKSCHWINEARRSTLSVEDLLRSARKKFAALVASKNRDRSKKKSYLLHDYRQRGTRQQHDFSHVKCSERLRVLFCFAWKRAAGSVLSDCSYRVQWSVSSRFTPCERSWFEFSRHVL